MNAERYERVGELFHAALELPLERRAAFLADACAGDDELRRDVESLLAAHEEAGDFVARPAMEVTAEWDATLGGADDAEPISGRIGAYDVLSLIGRGGMGEVYSAEDTRLGRKVGGQSAAALPHQQPRCGTAIRAGSARRLVAQPSEHRHDLRDWHVRRAPLPGDGARRRAVAGGDCPEADR